MSRNKLTGSHLVCSDDAGSSLKSVEFRVNLPYVSDKLQTSLTSATRKRERERERERERG